MFKFFLRKFHFCLFLPVNFPTKFKLLYIKRKPRLSSFKWYTIHNTQLPNLTLKSQLTKKISQKSHYPSFFFTPTNTNTDIEELTIKRRTLDRYLLALLRKSCQKSFTKSAETKKSIKNAETKLATLKSWVPPKGAINFRPKKAVFLFLKKIRGLVVGNFFWVMKNRFVVVFSGFLGKMH